MNASMHAPMLLLVCRATADVGAVSSPARETTVTLPYEKQARAPRASSTRH